MSQTSATRLPWTLSDQSYNVGSQNSSGREFMSPSYSLTPSLDRITNYTPPQAQDLSSYVKTTATTVPNSSYNPNTGVWTDDYKPSGGSPAPAGPAPVNLMDRNANPGEGWGWHGDDGGWKRDSGQSEVDRWNEQMRNEINQGYGVAERNFNDMLGTYLPQQRSAQEAIAAEQKSRGLDMLGQQQQESQSQFQQQEDKTMTGQKKSLGDIADKMRNWMMAGNIKLGGIGAGDSSAQNMMNYAYGKMGNKLGGDVMSQTAGTMADIGQKKLDFEREYQRATRDVESEYNQKINEVSSWFAEQQNSLRAMQGELGVNKGKDLAAMSQNMLNQAMNAVNMAQQEAAQRRSMLDQWAMQNSTNINQLQQNLQGMSNTNYATPQANYGAVNPSVQVGAGATQSPSPLYGGGTNTEDQTGNLLGIFNQYR